MENWCLHLCEVKAFVQNIWRISIVGSAAYVLSRRLSMLRQLLKVWCLDKKLFWGVNWKSIFNQLQFQGNQITTLDHRRAYNQRQSTLTSEATLAFSYWRQRIKNYIQIGELPSKVLFSRLRQRKQKNMFHMLRNVAGIWVSTPQEVHELIHLHFKSLLTNSSSTAVTDDSIDLVLRELNLPTVSPSDCENLLRPFSSQEI